MSGPPSGQSIATGFRTVWSGALRDAWRERRRLVILTLALWIPWNLLTGVLIDALPFDPAVKIPVSLALEALFVPFYGACVLVVLASGEAVPWGEILRRGLKLLPRFWLIELKITAIGLAIPFGILHLGSAVLLQWAPSYIVAKGIMVATVTGALWTLGVMFTYVLAEAVLVADAADDDWRGRKASSAWNMWVGRKLLSGNVLLALSIVISGQAVIGVADLLSPSIAGIVGSLIHAAFMIVSAVWWALIWELQRYCLALRAPRRAQVSTA